MGDLLGRNIFVFATKCIHESGATSNEDSQIKMDHCNQLKKKDEKRPLLLKKKIISGSGLLLRLVLSFTRCHIMTVQLDEPDPRCQPKSSKRIEKTSTNGSSY